MKHTLNLLLFAFITVIKAQAQDEYTVDFAPENLKYIEYFQKGPDGYYALRTAGKTECHVLDKNLKLVKTSSADKAALDLFPFRLENNLYLLTVKFDSKKGSLDFYYSTYEEPAKLTLFKSQDLKQYTEGGFYNEFVSRYAKSFISNTNAPYQFRAYYNLIATADHQNLIFYWINPDSLISLAYDVTVFDKNFKPLSQHHVKSNGGFSYGAFWQPHTDARGNVYFFNSDGEGGIDYSHLNFKTGETGTKAWQLQQTIKENVRYRPGSHRVDTATGEITMVWYLPFKQHDGNLGTTGINRTADMGIVTKYNAAGDLITKFGIRFTEQDMNKMRERDDEGNAVNTNMVYPDYANYYKFSNGNYAVVIQTMNYRLLPPTSISNIYEQNSMSAGKKYYAYSSNNYVVHVYNSNHEEINHYNLYRRRLRSDKYVGSPYGFNDQFWLFYIPSEEEYKPDQDEAGMAFAYIINSDGSMTKFKAPLGQGTEPWYTDFEYSDKLPGVPVRVKSNDNRMGFLHRK